MQGHSGTATTKYASTKLNGSHQSLRSNNNTSLTSKRMSAGTINIPSRGLQLSNSLNSRQPAISTGQSQRVKSGVKKINQSSSVNPKERENAHKVQTFLDETSQQFVGMGGKVINQASSLTRSNRDYQRSPGKIFSGNVPGAQALLAASSQTTKNSGNKAINYVKSTQGSQLQGKRQSKPQLMSELALSLKNKKQTPTVKPSGANYQNLIKPLVSAGRAAQSTKHTPANMDNFSGRSYTQRVGAANAASNHETFSGPASMR